MASYFWKEGEKLNTLRTSDDRFNVAPCHSNRTREIFWKKSLVSRFHWIRLEIGRFSFDPRFPAAFQLVKSPSLSGRIILADQRDLGEWKNRIGRLRGNESSR